MKKGEPDALVCAYADEPMIALGSIFDRSCGTCGRKVMIAPSGQALLAAKPNLQILCMACFVVEAAKAGRADIYTADPERVAQEMATARPNPRRRRN
jgi:hypothetical protein